MPYMIYQQVTTAVRNAYRGHAACQENYEKAKACRQWLASLEIEDRLRAPLVEQIAVLEEAFKSLAAEGES